MSRSIQPSLIQRARDNIAAISVSLAAAKGLLDQAALGKAIEKASAHLEDDLALLLRDAGFIFMPSEDSDDLARNNRALLRAWHLSDRQPSLLALCLFAMDRFNLGLDPSAVRRVIVAAVLGEIDNPLTYHNPLHYKKVLLQVLQLIATHNGIYDGTRRALNDDQVALLMIAACLHDLGHDGLGNFVKGVHYPGRLERHACTLAEAYFRATDCYDDAMMVAVRAMIAATDVSPLGDASSPVNQMKAAYRRHFLDKNSRAAPLNLDTDLKPLEHLDSLALMALLLHEGDIATSAGLDYEVTKFETALYRQEIGEEESRPQHIIDFLNEVCQRRMLSDAGQQLYAANMARIYALAEHDVIEGNSAYPAPAQSGFLSGHISATDRSGYKTIN